MSNKTVFLKSVTRNADLGTIGPGLVEVPSKLAESLIKTGMALDPKEAAKQEAESRKAQEKAKKEFAENRAKARKAAIADLKKRTFTPGKETAATTGTSPGEKS